MLLWVCEFESLDALVSAVGTRPTDVNQLFCEFFWICRNMLPDDEKFPDGVQSNHDLLVPANVFDVQTATAPGFANLFQDIAERCGVSGFDVTTIDFASKCTDWDSLNPRALPARHRVNLVRRGDKLWVCDGAWAATCSRAWSPFKLQRVRSLFMVPLVRSLHHHYPFWDAQLLEDFTLSYVEFMGAPQVFANEFDFRIDSIPLRRRLRSAISSGVFADWSAKTTSMMCPKRDFP
jgi:hypothetical protein